MLLIGTTVPPLVPIGTAPAIAGFNADAATRTAGKERRTSEETLIDILSIIPARWRVAYAWAGEMPYMRASM